MTKLTKNKFEQIVTSGLGLKDARFQLEKYGNRIIGHVVSPSFRGMDDYDRQKRMLDVLEAEFGAEALKRIGMILAYTPEEWNFDEVEPGVEVPPKKRRKIG